MKRSPRGLSMAFARTISGCLIPLLAAAIEIAVATHAATAQQPEPTQMATAQPGINQAAQTLADAIAANPEGGQALVDAIAAIVAANPAIAVQVVAVAKSARSPVVDALAAGLAAAQASLAVTNPAAAAAISAQVAKSNGAFQIAFASAGGTIGNGIAGRGIG